MSDTEETKQQQQQEEEKQDEGPKFVYTAFTAAAWIILLHELLERFSFYGTKAILTFYLNDFLHFDADTTTIIYHLFTGISYLTPLIGTFMSDNFTGAYKTIVILGIVYVIGHALMPITSLWRNIPGPLISMLVLAIGTGGIKPCVAAFGGDQVEAGNERVVDAFFSVFYMCINIGAFTAQLLTPILRQVSCVEGSCYPLAFGVPAAAFVISYALFLVGTPKYTRYPKPESPMLNKAVKVIVSGKLSEKNVNSSEDTPQDRAFYHDVRQAVQVCFLFLPLPIYWALFDQQGSRWVLQGKRMDGYLGEGFSITADMMQSVNPLLIVLVVPIFNNIVYPLFAKCNALKSATSRIFWGYIVCSLAFGVTGLMEVVVDGTLPVELPNTEAKLHMFNGNDCPVRVGFGTELKTVQANTLETFADWKLPVREGSNSTTGQFLTVWGDCANHGSALPVRLTLSAGSTNLVIVHNVSHSLPLPIPYTEATARLRVAFGETFGQQQQQQMPDVKFQRGDLACLPHSNVTKSGSHLASSSYCEISSRQPVPMLVDGTEVRHSASLEGGIKYVTVFVKRKADGSLEYHDILDRQLNPPHILLQLPQYLLMCTSEILTSVTALAFAYSEAPASLKSLLQSAYLVSIFFGNMIVIAVAALPRLPRQSYEFFLFAGLVFIGGFVQLLVIYFYRRMRDRNNRVQPMEIELVDGEEKGEEKGEENGEEKGEINEAFAPVDDEKERPASGGNTGTVDA